MQEKINQPNSCNTNTVDSSKYGIRLVSFRNPILIKRKDVRVEKLHAAWVTQLG